MAKSEKLPEGKKSKLFIKEKTMEGKKNAAITGRMILQGKLRLTSPMIIGGGKVLFADSDIVVLKDENGDPYIPSSSLTGVLKYLFADYCHKEKENEYKYRLNKLWFWGGEYISEKYSENGLSQKLSCQSAMLIDDLLLDKASKSFIRVRDGIKIDPKTGLVESGKKFDFEMVEPGACFNFSLEVVVRNAYDKDLFRSFVQWIVSRLTSGQLAVGARTAQGYGRCKLEKESIAFYDFNFTEKEHVLSWLSGNKEKARVSAFMLTDDTFLCKEESFSIKANFRICNSLIVGSYSGDPGAPDKVHLKSRNHEGQETAVLPGTSLRGAVRSRAKRILLTMGNAADADIKGLFGWVDDKNEEKPIKSRVIIEERPISQGTYIEEIQYRIRIDRFTGGVINAALFDSMPIWSREGNESMVTLELTIKDYADWEAGLMMLVLKDLWNADLAVGGEKNIGRGTLQGQRAEISLPGQKIIMVQNENGLQLYKEGYEPAWNEEAAKELERFVEALLIRANQSQQPGSEVVNSEQ